MTEAGAHSSVETAYTEVYTVIHDLGEARDIAWIRGSIWPPVGTVIELERPSRHALVVGIRLVLLEGDRAVVRVDAAVGHHHAVRGRRSREHCVVGGRVPAGPVHREPDAASAGLPQHLEQLLGRLAKAVGIVRADVRVRVVEREPAGVLEQPVVVGPEDRVDLEHEAGRL